MKLIPLSKKQEKKMKGIVKFFLEATEPISNPQEKAMVSVKILSRLACYSDKLTRE